MADLVFLGGRRPSHCQSKTYICLFLDPPAHNLQNKTSSAVQIRHTATGIVVKNQETRSREQNRKLARRILAEKLEELEKGSESRTAIKTERARSKKASRDKKARRKYRKLEEGKVGGADGEGEENVGVSEEGGREEGAGGGEKG